MKKLVFLMLACMASFHVAFSQCNTNNATTCQCKDGSSDCDLLPDLQIGPPPFYQSGTNGIIEFSQTGNGADNGRLKITVSTPNVGHGTLELRAQNIFICGTDTFVGTAPAICPDGVTYPRQLIKQRVYHKTGNTMSFWDRDAGTMTYHPSHGHMHVDDWGIYSLRSDNGNPNPLNWPIIGNGAKLAFCVMDYGNCPSGTYTNHCRDSLGNPMNSASNFPNYGLGGGNYNCSPTIQGISSGYLDIYWTSLDGMWINIPPGVCNGDYYIVTELDPLNYFLEENENNNIYVAPFTLTKQTPNNAASVAIIANGQNTTSLTVCSGTPVTLSIDTTGLTSVLWSTGATTPSITVTQDGAYTVDITSACGSFTTNATSVDFVQSPAAPSTVNDTIYQPGSATLTASGSNTIQWFDQPTGGTLLGTGSAFATPVISDTTSYWAQDAAITSNTVFAGPVDNNTSAGSYSTTSQYLLFDVYKPILLEEVTVYSQSGGSRTIELSDNAGTVINSAVVNLAVGANTVTLNFSIPVGAGYRLARTGGELFRNNPGASGGSMPFPYVSPGVLSITGTSQGNGYYYFFYNWKVSHSLVCASPRTEAVAVVDQSTALFGVDFIEAFSAFPNPSTGLVYLSFNLVSNSMVELLLSDNLGKQVYAAQLVSSNGTIEKAIDLSHLPKGVYTLHLNSNEKSYYHKMVLN